MTRNILGVVAGLVAWLLVAATLGFIMRTADRLLLQQMLRGVIEGNPRFGVVSAFYATEDVVRWGDKVHVARPLSMLRGVSNTLTSANSSR